MRICYATQQMLLYMIVVDDWLFTYATLLKAQVWLGRLCPSVWLSRVHIGPGCPSQ